jgi:hypothetical protein
VKALSSLGSGFSLLARRIFMLEFMNTQIMIVNCSPADMAGIKVEGRDQWLTLIQNASRKMAKT